MNHNSRTRPDTHFTLRLSAEQTDALELLSKERDVTVQSLVREGVRQLTGVPDPIKTYKRIKAAAS
jgi:hypothetical protein